MVTQKKIPTYNIPKIWKELSEFKKVISISHALTVCNTHTYTQNHSTEATLRG